MTHIVRIAILIIGSLAFCSAQEKETFGSRTPRYRIHAGDVIDVHFRYTPEYNQTVTVQPDGFIAVDIAGEFKIAGMTRDEVAVAIAEAAGKRLREPDVTVTLKEFVHPHFTVAGEVARPGQFDLRGNVTATQAVALAGGFKDSAKHSAVVLVRRVNDEWAETKVIDLKHMMSARALVEDPVLQPGDMLMVPQNVVSRLERFVRWTSLGVYGVAALRP